MRSKPRNNPLRSLSRSFKGTLVILFFEQTNMDQHIYEIPLKIIPRIIFLRGVKLAGVAPIYVTCPCVVTPIYNWLHQSKTHHTLFTCCKISIVVFLLMMKMN